MTEENKLPEMTLETPFGKITLKYIKGLTIALLILALSLLAAAYSVYEKGLVYGWIDSKANFIDQETAELAEHYNKVSRVIDTWINLSSVSDFSNSDVQYVRANIEDANRRFRGYSFSNFEPELAIWYLHHLAKLHVVSADVLKRPADIFMAEYYLGIAISLAKGVSRLSTKQLDYLDKYSVTDHLRKTNLNIAVFKFNLTNIKSYQDEAKEILNRFGGCDYLTRANVRHKDIYSGLECEYPSS